MANNPDKYKLYLHEEIHNLLEKAVHRPIWVPTPMRKDKDKSDKSRAYTLKLQCYRYRRAWEYQMRRDGFDDPTVEMFKYLIFIPQEREGRWGLWIGERDAPRFEILDAETMLPVAESSL